jgi:hypothetical protein
MWQKHWWQKNQKNLLRGERGRAGPKERENWSLTRSKLVWHANAQESSTATGEQLG